MRLTMRPEDLKEQFGFEFSLKKWNFRLTAEVLLLSGVGVTVVGAIAPQYELRQAGGVVLGAALMCAFALWDYRRLAGMGWLLYLGGMGLLLAVNLMGAISGGAARWLDVGPLRFQPSELGKLLFILFFAWLPEQNREKLDRSRFLHMVLALMAAPVASILEQPDLSTSVVVSWIFLWLLILGGISGRWIRRAVLAAVPLMGVLGYLITRPGQRILSEYQYRRIAAWLNPGEWAQDSYQQRNSIIAIGSGGLTGKGLENQDPVSILNSGFLPEPHTDFIMAAVGEKLGFAGCCAVILLLALIVFECMLTAYRTNDRMGRLICAGMGAWIGGQAFVNLCVVSGLMPNTGLTLPFVSYGLTSLVSLYMGVGVVMGVGMRRNG